MRLYKSRRWGSFKTSQPLGPNIRLRQPCQTPFPTNPIYCMSQSSHTEEEGLKAYTFFRRAEVTGKGSERQYFKIRKKVMLTCTATLFKHHGRFSILLLTIHTAIQHHWQHEALLLYWSHLFVRLTGDCWETVVRRRITFTDFNQNK